MTENARDGWFVKAGGVIGDLGNLFYGEERRRDVWNEASAVGFQLMLVLGLVAAGAMFWIGGQPAVPYGQAMLAVIGVPSLVAVLYAKRLGVDAGQPQRMWRARMIPFLVLVAVVVVGYARAAAGDDSAYGTGLAWGAAIGAGVALLCIAVPVIRERRRAR